MKKIIICISLLFIFSFFTGCKKAEKEEQIILSNQEKIELLQEMQMPLRKVILLETQINSDIYEAEEVYKIDGILKSYFDLNNLSSFTNYTNIEFDIKSPEFDGLGKANLYVNNQKAYLDVDTKMKVGGTETTIKSQEVMDIYKLIDPNIIIDYYDKINLNTLKDLDPIEIINEANNIIEFIDIYQKGKEFRFEVKITKDRLIAASDYITDKSITEIIAALSNDSYVTFNIIFIDKILVKMILLGQVNISLSNGFAVEADASFALNLNPPLPQLPNPIQLVNYNQVEFFTILDKLNMLK